MKKTMTLFCLFAGLFAAAQVRAPFTNNDLRNNLEKVVGSFSSGFADLKGEVIAENPQTIEYATLLEFRGAEENSITRYLSHKPVYSWQATLLTTEEFEEAEKKYKWLFNQLKVMTLTINKEYSFSLNGDYDAPDESRKFAVSTMVLTPAAVHLPKLKIEVSMNYVFPEWKVQLTVFQKEREDNERGQTREY